MSGYLGAGDFERGCLMTDEEDIQDDDARADALPSFAYMVGGAVLIMVVVLGLRSWADFRLSILMAGVALLAGFLMFLSWSRNRAAVKIVPSDRFVLRNTENGRFLVKPGDRYRSNAEHVEIRIRPDRHLFQTSAGPRMLRWQPDPENLDAYVEFFKPLTDTARADFIAGADEFFRLNQSPTVEFLQDRYADHLGVKILTLDLPPAPEKPKEQPRDTRSKAEREIDRLFAGVKTAADAHRRWADLQKDPDFAAALSDPKIGEKLKGKFEDVIDRIAEGDD